MQILTNTIVHTWNEISNIKIFYKQRQYVHTGRVLTCSGILLFNAFYYCMLYMKKYKVRTSLKVDRACASEYRHCMDVLVAYLFDRQTPGNAFLGLFFILCI